MNDNLSIQTDSLFCLGIPKRQMKIKVTLTDEYLRASGMSILQIVAL